VDRYRPFVLGSALLLVGCLSYNQEAERPQTLSWSASAVDTIDIDVENGAVSLTAGTDTLVTAVITLSCRGRTVEEAESRLDDIVLTDSVIRRTLRLRADVPTPNNRSYNAEFEIRAPAGTALKLKADNGAVNLTDMAARADIGAKNGAVTLVGHQGSVVVDAANGAVDCDCALVPAGSTLRLHSSNGRVTLSVPAGVSLAFDAWTSNGVVRLEGLTASYSRSEEKHKTGIIGTGAASAKLDSKNGSVTIRAR
jgi:hypothetical protein